MVPVRTRSNFGFATAQQDYTALQLKHTVKIYLTNLMLRCCTWALLSASIHFPTMLAKVQASSKGASTPAHASNGLPEGEEMGEEELVEGAVQLAAQDAMADVSTHPAPGHSHECQCPSA